MQGTQRWRDAYAGRIEDPQRRRYAELVSTTDELIGQVISQGETRDQAVFGCDWLPTIADDAGCSLPTAKLDGRSIRGVIESSDADSPHDHLYWLLGKGPRAQWVVRQGDWNRKRPT